MSRSAGKSWGAKLAASAMLLPLLVLSACANSGDAMNEKVAAAEAAADKALAAQHAAEKAAATAATVQPAAAAPAAEPTVMADTGDESDGNSDDDGRDGHGDGDVVMGGEPSTVAGDGTVIPGRGV